MYLRALSASGEIRRPAPFAVAAGHSRADPFCAVDRLWLLFRVDEDHLGLVLPYHKFHLQSAVHGDGVRLWLAFLPSVSRPLFVPPFYADHPRSPSL